MIGPVVFTPEAEAQLTELFRYIAVAASPDVAARYTDAIVAYCENLQTFPLRGAGETTSGLAYALPVIESGS